MEGESPQYNIIHLGLGLFFPLKVVDLMSNFFFFFEETIFTTKGGREKQQKSPNMTLSS